MKWRKFTSTELAVVDKLAMSPPGHLIEIRTEDLCKFFGGKVVLRGVDLEIQRGQMVAIIGAREAAKQRFSSS